MSNTADWLEQLISGHGDSPRPQYSFAVDTAVLQLPTGCALATSVDTLVCGVHFTMTARPADIGYKSLAVNLSDLAAMGASPSAALLSLTATAINTGWLAEFGRGFKTLADQFDVQLLGGTFNRGPLAVTVNVYGHLPAQHALRRDNATAGDLIFVTGTLGDAGLALAMARGELAAAACTVHRRYLDARLNRPKPRIAEGIALRSLASSAIDVSDGLLADLGHVLTASHVGATIDVARLPLSQAMMSSIDLKEARRLALSAGDDYELCFTVAPDRLAELRTAEAHLHCPIQHIGTIDRAGGLRCSDEACLWAVTRLGYQHFA
nr:thiamine-phosphate kinase [Gammaproteobacteria bacterium]